MTVINLEVLMIECFNHFLTILEYFFRFNFSFFIYGWVTSYRSVSLYRL